MKYSKLLIVLIIALIISPLFLRADQPIEVIKAAAREYMLVLRADTKVKSFKVDGKRIDLQIERGTLVSPVSMTFSDEIEKAELKEGKVAVALKPSSDTGIAVRAKWGGGGIILGIIICLAMALIL